MLPTGLWPRMLLAAATPATVGWAERTAIILNAYRMFLRGRHVAPAGECAVRSFLEHLWDAAITAGWSDVELFGANPDPQCVCVRLDGMGAVTLSAATGDPITDVQTGVPRVAIGLAYFAGERVPSGPVWEVVFLSGEECSNDRNP
jgi:hypothetical protein